MGIFDEIETPIVDEVFKSMKNFARGNLNAQKFQCEMAFNMLWKHDKETVQAVLDKFGVDASTLFIHHKAWQDFIKAVDPSYESMKPPYQLTFNQDGTVTVGDKIEEEQNG